LGEIEASVAALTEGPVCPWLALLQCTSEYPAPMVDCNLRVIETLRRAFGRPVGFSDHTEGVGASPLAVAMGACLIEKHFTLDRALPGPDHRASLDPAGFAGLVQAVRLAEAALGNGVKKPEPSEIANKPRMRKSLVARHAIAAGSVLTAADLTCKRPGDGLPPLWFDRAVGRRTTCALEPDQQIALNTIEWAIP